MFSKIAADAVLLFHFAFIVFALFGALAVLRSRRLAWIHLSVVLWASVVNLAGWVCPLTPLENWFRSRAGESGYEGGFVQHHLERVIYPGGMPRKFELIAGVSVVVWNVLLYACIRLYRAKHPRKTC